MGVHLAQQGGIVSGLSVALVLIFAPLAALSSYLITYIEYKKHFPEDPKKARRQALYFALAALLFFAFITFLFVFLIDKLLLS